MNERVTTRLPDQIESRRSDVAQICTRLGVRRLELFGSGTRTDSPNDLDFLADLGDHAPAQYAAIYFSLREELEKLFAKPVDIVTPPGLSNPHFRQRVEQEKILLYAS